ncbi:MAG: hypothetical protein QNL04_00455 [SAR324 cluster bacterium]|nr:hypothetical protein [SAR324 cluster bacterium]
MKGNIIGLVFLLSSSLIFSPWAQASTKMPSFAQTPTAQKYYTDAYNLIFHLGERSFIKLEILLTNLSIGPTRGVCHIFYFNGGNTQTFQVHTSPKAWEAVPHQSLQVLGCSLEKRKGALLVKAKIKSFDFSAEIAGPFGSNLKFQDLRPLDSRLIRNSGEFESTLILPSNSASYQLKYQDQPPKSGRATMLLYRYWATAAPKEVAKEWVRAYYFKGGRTKILFGFREKTRGDWKASRLDFGAVKFAVVPSTESKSNKQTTASKLDLNLDEKQGLLKGLGPQTLREFFTFDFVKEMGWYGPLLSLFVKNPVTHFFYSETNPEEVGLIEVTRIN